MREIKFRAWDKRLELMSNPKTLEEICKWYRGGFKRLGRIQTKSGLALSFKGFDFMQFTGLLDKNGKEIYEGDILKTILIMKPEMVDVLWEVKWMKNEDGNMWGWMCKNKDEMYILDESLQEQGKIIGNVFENEELLK